MCQAHAPDGEMDPHAHPCHHHEHVEHDHVPDGDAHAQPSARQAGLERVTSTDPMPTPDVRDRPPEARWSC